jgi:hypothetical protein
LADRVNAGVGTSTNGVKWKGSGRGAAWIALARLGAGVQAPLSGYGVPLSRSRAAVRAGRTDPPTTCW